MNITDTIKQRNLGRLETGSLTTEFSTSCNRNKNSGHPTKYHIVFIFKQLSRLLKYLETQRSIKYLIVTDYKES